MVSEPAVAYGLQNETNIFNLMEIVRKGLNYAAFLNLTKRSPFNISDWSSFLHLSERTMQRYEKEDKVFDTVYSEKIIQITQLYNYGIEVFGNSEQFDFWLETPNLALGKVKPKEFLDNLFGIELLKNELNRIEHGILA